MCFGSDTQVEDITNDAPLCILIQAVITNHRMCPHVDVSVAVDHAPIHWELFVLYFH